MYLMSLPLLLLATASSNQREDDQEEIHDVHVQVEGAKDVLLGTQLKASTTDKQLCIIGQELRKQEWTIIDVYSS